MPDDLGEVPSAASENEKIATMGVTLETLLNLQGQPPHASAHVGMTGRDPDPATRWNGDQDRSAVSTRRNAARFTSRPTRTCRPSPSSISIRSERGGERVDDDARSDPLADVSVFIDASNTRTGTYAGVSISRKVPSRI
jgi:hypothetical protein